MWKRYGRQYYYSNPVPFIPAASVVPVSIGIDAGSFRIQAEVTSFIVCSISNLVSDFEDESFRISLSDGIDTAVEDPTILLDQYHLPSDGCLALEAGIVA